MFYRTSQRSKEKFLSRDVKLDKSYYLLILYRLENRYLEARYKSINSNCK